MQRRRWTRVRTASPLPPGNTSLVSDSLTVTVDSGVPAIPVIDSVDDNVGPIVGNIDAGDFTNGNIPTITGSGENGTTVILYSNGIEVGRGAVIDGKWTITTGVLKDGPTTLTVAATDAAGNVSEAGNAFAFTIDTVPPGIPQLVDISNSTLASNTLYLNSVNPTLNGTSEPLSTVTVFVDGNYLGQATANGAGEWQLSVTDGVLLTDNQHSITVVASDAAGNTSESSPVTITVDTQAPGAPQEMDVASGGTPLTGTAEPGSTITVKGPGDVTLGTGVTDNLGNFSVALTPPQSDAVTLTVVASDVAGNASEPVNYNVEATPALPDVPAITAIIDDNGSDALNVKGLSSNDATPTLSGTAIPGSLVTIYMDGTPLVTGPVVADPVTGAWSVPILLPLGEGSHSFTATATVGLQTSGESPAATVNIDLTPPATPVLGTVVDDVGTVTGALISGQRTNDTQPTLNGTATPGDTISIYANDTLLGSALVSNTGA